MRNVVSQYKNKGLAKMVCEAAFSYRRKDSISVLGRSGKPMQRAPLTLKALVRPNGLGLTSPEIVTTFSPATLLSSSTMLLPSLGLHLSSSCSCLFSEC
ncbi:unnamed protein product [Brassica oleracea]